jgi:hypothetical protein
LLTGLIVGLLKKHYNIEKLIECKVWWLDLKNNGGSEDIIDTNEGLKREQAFLELAENDFKKLLPIIEKMYKEIKKVKN